MTVFDSGERVRYATTNNTRVGWRVRVKWRLMLPAVAGLLAGAGLSFPPTSTYDSASPSPAATALVAQSTAIPRPTATPAPTTLPVVLSADTTVLAYPAPPIQAHAAILIDTDTGRVLYAKNENARLPMASTTKITTAVLALQHGGLNDLVRVSRNAASVGESTMALSAGERVTVRQLLYGLLLNSGNDAAVALAEHVAGSEARFVARMNALARTLGMRNTHYVTPHGLDEPGHYSSARDLATVAMYGLRDPTFRQIVDTESYYVPPTKHNQTHWLANVNRVLYWYPGVDGVKPGDTDNSGLCQVVSVNRDGRHLLAVLLNTPTLVTDIRNLLNFGLRDFRWVQAPDWWDGPSDSLGGGSGEEAWIYYFGAGHYIRGQFLAYFKTHGGLTTLGYPRTEEITDGGLTVQYFQGGELANDPAHDSVYPMPLGAQLALRMSRRAIARSRAKVSRTFSLSYRELGGVGVLGPPLAGPVYIHGHLSQLFEYGMLGTVDGAVHVAPLGDAALRARGWLPATGGADSYDWRIAPVLTSWVRGPARSHGPTPLPAEVPPAIMRSRLQGIVGG